MKYGITGLTYSPDRFIEITKAEFDDLAAAKVQIVTFIGIEEKFDLLLENYADYERELLEVSLQTMLFNDIHDERPGGHSHVVTRRLVNLLSAARLYLDQVTHDLKAIYGPSSGPVHGMEEAKSREYDGHLGYRVMEELRNHVQHRGMPLWGMSYPSSWDESGKRRKFFVTPILDIPLLRDDPKFDRAIITELASRGEQVLLTPLVRGYVEGLGVVHEAVRAATDNDATRSEQSLVETQNRAYAHFGISGDAIGLVALDDNGEPTTEQHIFRQQWEYRRELAAKNSALSRLASRYISSEHEEPEQRG